MALTTISDLTSAIQTGARSNLFKVTVGTLTDNVDRFSYLCKGAQLPNSSLGLIEVPFTGGRRFKLAGDRVFADWTTTVMNDANFYIREALENLQKFYGVTNYEKTFSKELTGGAVTDFQDITVEQFDQAGNVTYKYTLFNCWPSDISTIELSYDSVDTIEEFTVTWSYDYFTFSSDSSVTTTTETE
jgi:hypothetical protein